MKIGIIGAGNIGRTLARKLTKLGHKASIANSRGPESLAALAAETGVTAVSVGDAVKGVDLVVVTIPQKSVQLLPAELFRGVQQPGTPVYCTDWDAAGVRSALARADRARAPELRELGIAAWPADGTPDDMLRWARKYAE
jgi:3-hydroxyisobutyrate dehydrogenase-like beta-hydroxyacid dehydrogenase